MEQMGEFIGFTALIVIGSILLVAFRKSVTEFLKRRLGMKVVGGFRKRIRRQVHFREAACEAPRTGGGRG